MNCFLLWISELLWLNCLATELNNTSPKSSSIRIWSDLQIPVSDWYSACLPTMESRKRQQMEKGFCLLEAIYSSCWAGVPKRRKLLLDQCVLWLKIGEHSEVFALGTASIKYQPQTGLPFSVGVGSLAGFSPTAFSPSEVLQRMKT